MKIFIIKISLFFAVIILIDLSLGQILDYIQIYAKGGATFRDNFICNELTCDVLLLGSSRCEHHYNPIIISDSLGITCYNAGQAGNGIIVAYARYLMISERKRPLCLVYDVTPDFDLLKGYDNHRYLTWLRSYYDRECVKEIFETVDKMEKYKMISHLYRYNSRFIEEILDWLHPISDTSLGGFEPLNGEMDKNKIVINKNNNQPIEYVFDSLKISYLENIIDHAGKDRIVFTISPRWYGMDEKSYKPLVEMCKEKGVLLLDFANNPKYTYHDLFFKDGNHLNARGADEFTSELIGFIKPYIKPTK